MSEFILSEGCIALGLRSGAVLFRGVTIATASEALREVLDVGVREAVERHGELAAVRATPELTRLYEIFRAVGVSPKKNVPSVPNLYRYTIKRGMLPPINNFVDAYNLMSVRTLYSLGAHDLAKLSLPVTMRLFTGDESFVPLGSNEPRTVQAGEFGYVDADNRVICRLDVVQTDFSKVTAATTDIMLIIEGTDAHDPAHRQEVYDATIALLLKHCGGTAEIISYPE
jgi:DNA/RNA-binding domain of Phe-tRNA-synthetase-like protein